MKWIVFDAEIDRWAALRTAARREKSLATSLMEAGARVYLPLLTRLTVSGGGGPTAPRAKPRASEVPVFAGYVFCAETDFLDNPRVSATTRATVAQVLRAPDPSRLRAELKSIADLLTNRKLVQERFVGGVGDVVRITGGSFAGYQGTIIRVKPNRWKVVLEVSFLGARQEVEIDEKMIDRI